jgi:hypothetical protein
MKVYLGQACPVLRDYGPSFPTMTALEERRRLAERQQRARYLNSAAAAGIGWMRAIRYNLLCQSANAFTAPYEP